MPKRILKSDIILHQLKLNVHLGWPAQERLKKQSVYLDIHIQFRKMPRACLTDELEDTFCYAVLTEKIQQTVVKKFRLIEHLGYTLYQTIQQVVPKNTRIALRITKQPNLKNLLGGVSFCCGDEEVLW